MNKFNQEGSCILVIIPLCCRNLLGIIDVEQWNMDFPGGGFRFKLGGGFKYFLFSPLFGEDSHFDAYFSKGLKPPTSKDFGEICVSPYPLGEMIRIDEHIFFFWKKSLESTGGSFLEKKLLERPMEHH